MAEITNRTEQWEGHTGLEVETFLKQELETLDQTVSNASVNITAVQGSVALLTEDVENLDSSVATLTTTTRNLGAALTTAERDIASLENNVSALTTEVNDVSDSIQSISNTVNETVAEFEEVKVEVEAMGVAVDAVSDGFNALREDLKAKYGFIRLEFNESSTFYHIEAFASEEDAAQYDTDPENYSHLRLLDEPIPISTVQGDAYTARLSTTLSNLANIVVTGGDFIVPLNYRSIKITQIGNENAGAAGTLIVQRSTDNGTTWSTVGTLPNILTSKDVDDTTTQDVNIGAYLAQGRQLIRLRASFEYENEEGDKKVVTSSNVTIGASVNKTNLSLTLTSNYEYPISAYDINGNAAPFSIAYLVNGSVAKTLYVNIKGSTGQISQLTYALSADVDSTNYTISVNEDSVYGYMTHGVKKVEAWLECEDGLGNTITSSVLVNRFMVVNEQTSGADLTKPYLLLQNVDSEITNFVQTEVAEYAVYSPSGEDVEVAFLLTGFTEDYETSKPEEYFRLTTMVAPRTANSLLTTIEIETEDEGTTFTHYDTYFRVRRIDAGVESDFMKESTNESSYYIKVDNTNAFTPISGATFLMNPKVRNNQEDKPDTIYNVKNDNAVVASTWTNFGFINDGWMTADDGQKVLRIMAGSTLEIERNIWAQFRSNPNSSMTFEMDFKIDNVTNTTDPIVQMLDGTPSSFRGVCMNALEGWVMNASNSNRDNCLFSWQEGKRTHLCINLHHQVLPNKGDVVYTSENASKAYNTIALARVLINGDCVREVPFSTTNADEWNSTDTGSIIIGNEGADIDIYSIRVYENKQIEMTDLLLRNYLATRPTSAEKTKIFDSNNLLESGKISLTKAQNAGLNCMVWHGVLPYHGNTAEQTGWCEYWRYDQDGNYLPEYSGTNCKQTKSLSGKGQGSTAKTYYDWNLQEDNSKVKQTIRVAIKDIHEEIVLSAPYTGDDGNQYVDIYGGHLGNNPPIETPENAKPYPYENGYVTVPDGWIDGNGKYRGMGYRVAEGTSLAQKKVIKINYASSMQNHLLGACKTYDLLHRLVVGETPLQEVIPTAVSAKHQEPFMFFNQEEGKDVYFKGMGTYGAGKADKVTWGFVKKQMPMYALIEGSDNNLPMTGFRVPFDKNTAIYSPEEEGWIYNGQQSFDFDLGCTTEELTDGWQYAEAGEAPTAAIRDRWADIHNFIYLLSTNIKYYNGTFAQFEVSDAGTKDFENKYWCTQGTEAFRLKRYDHLNKEWIDAGLLVNGAYQIVDIRTATETKATYDAWVAGASGNYATLNTAIIEARVAFMKKYLKYFVNEKSLQFNYCYVLGFLAGTDNSDKNTYYKIMPYGVAMETDSEFATWFTSMFNKTFDFSNVCQLYLDGDDMDSIFRTNNNSHQTKPYYIDRMHPYADDNLDECLYEGMGNQLFNFVEKAYEGTHELSNMMRSIMEAATTLVKDDDKLYGLESGKTSLWGFLHKYFFNIQYYFPQIAYMEQARIRYEFPKVLGFISSGGGARSIDPITQSLGSQLQNELQYMNQRTIYMTSYAGFGAWGGQSSYSIGLADAQETFSFTPAAMPDGSGATYTFTITPHQYIYPSYFNGQTFTQTHQRTAPTRICTFTIAENVLTSDSGMGICGINYISNLGELADISIRNAVIINGKRLVALSVGWRQRNIFRPTNLSITTSSLQHIRLNPANASYPYVNLSMLIRCRTMEVNGMLSEVVFPESTALTTIRFPYNAHRLRLQRVPNLKNVHIGSGNHYREVMIGEDVGTNTGFSWQTLVENIYNEQKTQTKPYLQSIHVENVNWTDFDAKALEWFIDRPSCVFKGTISIAEGGLVPAITWDMKNKINRVLGNVDNTNSVNYKGLLLNYTQRKFNAALATLRGNFYPESGDTFQFEVRPSSIYENTQTAVVYRIANGNGSSIGLYTGTLVVNSLSDTQHIATIRATIDTRYDGVNGQDTLTKDIELWNRPAQLGDLVYYDGTYSSVASYAGEKTPIGVCFYVAPRNADGSLNTTFNVEGDTQLRLMVALEDVKDSGTTSNFTSWQWGAYPNTSDETIAPSYSLYDISESTGARVNLTSNAVNSIYDIPTITNLSSRGIDSAYIDVSVDENSDYRDLSSEEGVANDGFKCITPNHAFGDGFAYKEAAEYTHMTTARTLTASLAALAGNDYKEGDIVNSGYIKLLKIIEHRNKILANDIIGADNELFLGAGTFAPPVGTSSMTELQALVALMESMRTWATNDLQDAYPNKWSQLAFPAASACYAYQPSVGSNETLADKFTAHNWWLPTEGQLARLCWYTKYGDLYGQNVFTDAEVAGVLSFSSSIHWSSTELRSNNSWVVYFHNGITGDSRSKYYSYVGRAVSAF